MTGTPQPLQDSGPESMNAHSGADDDGSGGNHPLALGGLGITVLSVALSGLGYGALPEQMRIHWTLGLGPYYGPEFAPTPTILIGFPAVIAGIALGAYVLDARLRRVEGFAAVRSYYAAGVVGTLGVLLASQAALILVAL